MEEEEEKSENEQMSYVISQLLRSFEVCLWSILFHLRNSVVLMIAAWSTWQNIFRH